MVSNRLVSRARNGCKHRFSQVSKTEESGVIRPEMAVAEVLGAGQGSLKATRAVGRQFECVGSHFHELRRRLEMRRSILEVVRAERASAKRWNGIGLPSHSESKADATEQMPQVVFSRQLSGGASSSMWYYVAKEIGRMLSSVD